MHAKARVILLHFYVSNADRRPVQSYLVITCHILIHYAWLFIAQDTNYEQFENRSCQNKNKSSDHWKCDAEQAQRAYNWRRAPITVNYCFLPQKL